MKKISDFKVDLFRENIFFSTSTLVVYEQTNYEKRISQYKIICKSESFSNTSSSLNYSLFDSFCEIRRTYEKDNLLFYRYGNAKHIFQAGLQLSMGSGERVYYVKGDTKKNVLIFDKEDCLELATLSQQAHFMAKYKEKYKK